MEVASCMATHCLDLKKKKKGYSPRASQAHQDNVNDPHQLSREKKV
jgi:hypothetical protein